MVQEKLGKLSDARKNWKKALAIDPANLEVWRLLAISLFKTGEYDAAIQPMERIKDLDHGEFVRIMGLTNDMFKHVPEASGFLSHFRDEMATGKRLAESPEKLAYGLISSFLRNGELDDPASELADYAETVTPYFTNRRFSRAQIAKDIADYRKRWPQRLYTLISLESVRRDDLDLLETTYVITFLTSDGKSKSSGKLLQSAQFGFKNGRWLVTGAETLEKMK